MPGGIYPTQPARHRKIVFIWFFGVYTTAGRNARRHFPGRQKREIVFNWFFQGTGGGAIPPPLFSANVHGIIFRDYGLVKSGRATPGNLAKK